MSDSRGQASIELVAFLPLVLVIALAVFSFLAAHAADEQAGAAAEAGALALLEGRDAETAVHDALPEGVRDRAHVDVDTTSVHVTVRPKLPIALLADHLTADERSTTGAR
jgi:hypothetical protein